MSLFGISSRAAVAIWLVYFVDWPIGDGTQAEYFESFLKGQNHHRILTLTGEWSTLDANFQSRQNDIKLETQSAQRNREERRGQPRSQRFTASGFCSPSSSARTSALCLRGST